MIYPIVEGDGEVQAVPVLLRRLIPELGVYIEIGQSIKRHRSDLVIEQKFKYTIQEIILPKPELEAVLILFDADDDCASSYVPQMLEWWRETASQIPCAVIMARREYEAWFLAAIDSLRGVRGISQNAEYQADPEQKRDAKGAVRRFTLRTAPYTPTADQPALSAVFDLSQAYRRASSFRKLVKELCRVLTELGHQPEVPTDWIAE